MNLKHKETPREQVRRLRAEGVDFRGGDFREADLGGVDLRAFDLRGADLRGADLSTVQNLCLTELVGEEDGEWVPLAAWDQGTRFPMEFEEKLWVLGLRGEPGPAFLARRRGLMVPAEACLVKTDGWGWRDVVPYSGCDG